MTRDVVVDLCCCEGGAARGYAQAGLTVVGVDIEPQPRYPYRFVQADAVEFLASANLTKVALIHASPPCQSYSRNLRGMAKVRPPKLIDIMLPLLVATGRPWVIENVIGAPLPEQDTLDGDYGVMLCGTMLGMPQVWRHRLFQSSFPIPAPRGCDHSTAPLNPMRGQGEPFIERRWRQAAGLADLSRYGARQAIPPAMAAYIASCLPS
jgi:DNA (cytosine-5)-methyltransferase 1